MKGDSPLKFEDSKPQDLKSITTKSRWTRRELLQRAAMAAALLPQDFPGGWGAGRSGRPGRGRFRPRRTVDPAQIPSYKYRILPAGRFPTLQNEYNAARNNGELGSSKLYRDQIASLNFKVPGDFPNARSVVVVAAYSKNMYSNFCWMGIPIAL